MTDDKNYEELAKEVNEELVDILESYAQEWVELLRREVEKGHQPCISAFSCVWISQMMEIVTSFTHALSNEAQLESIKIALVLHNRQTVMQQIEDELDRRRN